MEVHMENALARIASGIRQEAISALLDAQFVCNLSSGIKELEQDLLILCLKIIQRVRDMTAWNDQDMVGCLGLDILKGQHIFILIDSLAWDLARSDSTE
jgi:hypothetical protein